ARAQGRAVAVWVARSRLPSFLHTGLAQGLLRLNFRNSVVFYSQGAGQKMPHAGPTKNFHAS
ncbi:MAG: hypothetical protein ACYCSR_15950, partial [Thiomonas sp.]